MLSVEEKHPDFADSCHCLRPGQSAYSLRAEIPFDLHRYRDGWYVFWKNPRDGQIGRHLRTRGQLHAFLLGNWRVGTVVAAPKLSSGTKRRAPRRK